MNSSDIYAPLSSPGCIRVVNIEPAESSTDPLICSLQELDIIHGTGYRAFSALSYQWGDGSTPQRITLNGVRTSIGQNLYDFLVHARESGWTKHLWIDALSINQHDLPERNQQVTRMGEIYSLASSVLIWLGVLDSDEIFPLEDIEDAIDGGRRHWDDEDDDGCADDTRFKRRLMKMRQFAEGECSYGERPVGYTECLTKRGRRGLARVLQNPYWLRKWILQEVLLGGPNASIITNGAYVNITTIAPVVHRFLMSLLSNHLRDWSKARDDWVAAGRDDSEFEFVSPDLDKDEIELWGLRSLMGCHEYNGLSKLASGIGEFWTVLSTTKGRATYQPHHIIDLMQKYRDHRCSDSRDHVYALLGLCTHPPGSIPVDYSITMEELWRATIRVTLTRFTPQHETDKGETRITEAEDN